MIRAAGILFVAPDKSALFLKRADTGDHPGEWAFPGGKLEGDESILDCAVREAIEECGAIPDGKRELWTRQKTPTPNDVSPNIVVAEPVDFTTFIQFVDAPFVPTIDAESTGYAWAPITSPPQPMHPGCGIALDKFGMDELGIARSIRDGRLTSPQRYMNVTLFAIRLTGTGVSYRHALEEYVWRDPSIYLTQEFLERSQGLPVIWHHPAKAKLDSNEFTDRIVGTVFITYLQGNEVWAIAKLYDDEAVELMSNDQLSTSPGVVFKPTDGNFEMTLKSGENFLIEGKPSLLDHVAICERGVWDKGGDPTGVQLTKGDTMTEEEKKAAEKAKADADEKARKDAAENGTKLDKLLTGLDAVMARMDAQDKRMDSMESSEKARKDAEEKSRKDDEEDAKKKAEEKSKADAEESEKKKEEEKAKADADAKVKADADTAKRIADLEKRIPAQMTDADFRAMADTQARADSVFQAFGESAKRPLSGETLGDYRRRLANELKAHSPVWKDVNLTAIADDAAFKPIEEQIYAEARAAARKPVNLKEGEMREVVRVDHQTGTRVIEFYGKDSFVKRMKPVARRVKQFNLEKRAS